MKRKLLGVMALLTLSISQCTPCRYDRENCIFNNKPSGTVVIVNHQPRVIGAR